MKIGLLLLGTALLLGALVGTLVVRDPGYVLIAYDNLALETSIWFFLLALLAAYLLVRLILFVLRRTASSGGQLGGWLRRRQHRTARQQTTQGLLLMAEGQWQQARKVLTNAATRVESPLVNYLNAARAAHELGDMEGRDALLREAHESTPGSRLAVGLTQAELQRARGQWEQCLATLLRLREQSPRHVRVLGMLTECYEALHDDQALLEVLPDARKARVFDDEEHERLLVGAWRRRLEAATDDPADIWARVPKELEREPAVVRAYVRAEQQRGTPARALPALRRALQHAFDEELVTLYGQIRGEKPREQLSAAEGWLKEHTDNAALLLALGRISLMNEEWAKAREYFEASLRLARTPEIYAELGRLCSALGEVERGNEYLVQSLPELPDVPLPLRT